MSDYDDNDLKDPTNKHFDKRSNRFQKSVLLNDTSEDQLEDYPDMKVKKKQENSVVRARSEILEAKKKEIARRLEAN